MYVGVCVYLYTYVHGCTRGCMHVWHACMGTCVSVLSVCVVFPSSLCISLHAKVFWTRSVRFGPVAGDADLIRIRTRCGPDA